MTLAEQLLQAVQRSGLTRYRIAKDAGIDYHAFVAFLDEDRDIRLSTAQKLADYFGMRLTMPRQPKE